MNDAREYPRRSPILIPPPTSRSMSSSATAVAARMRHAVRKLISQNPASSSVATANLLQSSSQRGVST